MPKAEKQTAQLSKLRKLKSLIKYIKFFPSSIMFIFQIKAKIPISETLEAVIFV